MYRTTSILSLALGHFAWAHITQVTDTKLYACASASPYTLVMITCLIQDYMLWLHFYESEAL
jgi:hypothetical protein